MSYNPRIKIGPDGSLIISGNVELKAQSYITSSVINTTSISSSYLTSSTLPSSSQTALFNTGSGLKTFQVNAESSVTLDKNGHIILVNANSQIITLTLPSASLLPAQEFVIKKTDSTANSVNISGKINNVVTQVTLTNKNQTTTLVSDGTSSWWSV